MTITIEIPGEPMGKGRPRLGKDGHVHTPERTARWEQIAQWEARRQYRGEPLTGVVEVRIDAVFRIPESWAAWLKTEAMKGRVAHTGKPDWDNVGKLACDALNGIVWTDDAIIAGAYVTKLYGPVPGVTIRARPLEGLLHRGSKRNAEATA